MFQQRLKQYLSNQTKRTQQLTAVIVIVVVAAIGTYLLLSSHAATPFAATTADSGTLAGGAAVKQPCTGASDGSCVVFNGSGSGTQTTNCFASPGKCGYPDPIAADDAGGVANVGAGDCSKLPTFNPSQPPAGIYYSGSGNTIEVTGQGANISNLNLGNYSIYIDGVNNVTLNKICMSFNGGGLEGSTGIVVPTGVSGTTIENSTLAGMNSTNESVGALIDNDGANTTITKDYMYNDGGAGPGNGNGSATVTDNYEITNGVGFASSSDNDSTCPVNDSACREHYEAIYCSDNQLTITHNTLLNPHAQTAVIFCDTNGGKGGSACDDRLTIKDNLIAGGGYMLYPCGNATGGGSNSTIDVEANRFARCTGGSNCPTTDGSTDPWITCLSANNCPTTDGYWPDGGFQSAGGGITSATAYFGGTWTGNYWDDSPSQTICSNASSGCP